MAQAKFKCVVTEENGCCGRDFTFGEWECFPGQKHQVTPKTYYLADAPQVNFERDPDGLGFRWSRTECHVIPERSAIDPQTGQAVKQASNPAIFVKGRFETTDPEYQFFIERAKIDVGYDKWFNAYHTPKQKQNIKDGILGTKANELDTRNAELTRKEKEVNELLASLKEKAKKEKSEVLAAK